MSVTSEIKEKRCGRMRMKAGKMAREVLCFAARIALGGCEGRRFQTAIDGYNFIYNNIICINFGDVRIPRLVLHCNGGLDVPH